MAFGRILLAWAVVGAWLALWAFGERRVRGAGGLPPTAELAPLAGEALMAWPVRSWAGAGRVARVVVAGGLLAWMLRA